MREIEPEQRDYLTEVLGTPNPTQEQILKAWDILTNITLFSTQPHPQCPFFQWKKHMGHFYCKDDKAVYLSTNIMDEYFFMTGPLGWDPVEIEKAERDVCSFQMAFFAAKAFGDKIIVIDFQPEGNKKFFMYKTATMELTVGQRS